MDSGPHLPNIQALYKRFRQPLINWLVDKYQLDLDSATDIYQDAIIIFIENLYINKTATIRAGVSKKTYLYGIAKNKAREYLKKKNRTSRLTEFQGNSLTEEKEDHTEEKARRIEQAKKAFESLGDRCQELMIKAIVHKLPMKEIAFELQYENANTAKNMKYKCLQQLRKLFFQLNKAHNG